MNAQRISATEYIAKKDTGLTIDLRTAAEFESEHLEDTHPLPVQDLNEARLEKLLQRVDHKSEPLFLLCQSGKRADVAVEKLGDTDKLKLVIIEGGLNAVKSAGGNAVQGSRKTISLERQVRIAAGALSFSGVALGFLVHPGFFGVSAFVGAGLMFAGITDTCGMAMMLAQMPWNKSSKA